MSDILLFLSGLLAGGLAAVAVLLPALRASRAVGRLLEAQLISARHERQALEAELAATLEAAESRKRDIAFENAELRGRMDELADLLMREGARASIGTAPEARET